MDTLIENCFNHLNPGAFFTCASRTPESKNCLDCFRNQYFNGNKISYDCVEKRKIYLLRFFTAHEAENYKGAKIFLMMRLIAG